MPSHQLNAFLLCFGQYLQKYLLNQVLSFILLAAVQARTVPHLTASKSAAPAGSHLSSRTGLLWRGDWAAHSSMVVEGRRQRSRKPHVVHLEILLKLFASSRATEELETQHISNKYVTVYRGL